MILCVSFRGSNRAEGGACGAVVLSVVRYSERNIEAVGAKIFRRTRFAHHLYTLNGLWESRN